MARCSRHLLPLLGLVAWSSVAAAEPPRSPSLASLRGFAVAHSPRLSAVGVEFAEQLAAATEAELWDDPELQGSVAPPFRKRADQVDTEFEITVGQPVRLASFGYRQQLAELLRVRATAEQQHAVFALCQEITGAYARLWLLEEQRRVLGTAQKWTERLSTTVTAAVKAAALNRGEEQLFLAEAARSGALIVGIDAEVASASATLTELTGFPGPFEELPSLELPKLPSLPLTLERARAAPLSLRQRAALLAKISEQRFKVAEMERLGPVTPSLGYQHSSEGDDFISFGIAIPLPFWKANGAERERSAGTRAAAHFEKVFAEGDALATQITFLWRAASATQIQVETFQQRVLPTLRKSLSYQEQQFKAGAVSVLQIHQLQRELLNTELEWIEGRKKHLDARIALNILAGEEL